MYFRNYERPYERPLYERQSMNLREYMIYIRNKFNDYLTSVKRDMLKTIYMSEYKNIQFIFLNENMEFKVNYLSDIIREISKNYNKKVNSLNYINFNDNNSSDNYVDIIPFISLHIYLKFLDPIMSVTTNLYFDELVIIKLGPYIMKDDLLELFNIVRRLNI